MTSNESFLQQALAKHCLVHNKKTSLILKSEVIVVLTFIHHPQVVQILAQNVNCPRCVSNIDGSYIYYILGICGVYEVLCTSTPSVV